MPHFINHIWEYYFIYPLYTDINECAPDPCQNSGTCKDLVNGYECTCVPGYDGTNCDNGRNVNYIFGEENPHQLVSKQTYTCIQL